MTKDLLSCCKIMNSHSKDIEDAILLEAIELLMHCFLSRNLLPFIYAVLKTFYHGDEDGYAYSEGIIIKNVYIVINNLLLTGFEIVKELMAAKL